MFKARIKEVALAKGVKNYYQLGQLLDTKKTGDIKFEVMARRLWKGDHVPTLPTLAAVCDALDCELSDLIVRNGRKKKR
jgi:DNA-binding Xre family transcriptional regulator